MRRWLAPVAAPVAALCAGALAWWGIGALASVADPARVVVADAVAGLRTADSVPGGERAVGGEASRGREVSAVTAPAGVGPGSESFPRIAVTPARPTWRPSEAESAAALADARALPLKEAAGRVIVAAWSGGDAAGLASLVDRLSLGGVILMGSHGDAAQVESLAAAATGATDRDWGTIVGVDEEGGTVSRMAGVVPTLPGFMSAGAARDADVVTEAYRAQGASLAGLGVTMNFAPVADVTVGAADPVIRSRSAGDEPADVSATVDAAIEGYVDAGVVPVVKHFPGHGSVTTDSHHALPVQAASIEALRTRDLAPFQDAIDTGAPAVMMGHVAVEAWGGEPASLDPDAYAYLRDEMGFTGLAVTDALNMGAVAGDAGAVAVAALAAGADVLLMPTDPAAARDAIVDAVRDGSVPRARLDEAVSRVILAGRWQASLDGVESEAADGGKGGDAAAAARELAVAGASLAARDCDAVVVGDAVSLTGGTADDRALLAAALERRGVTVGSGGTRVQLLGSDTGSGDADVVVALAGPWGLEGSRADAYLGLYGRSAPSMAALADILTGDATAGGEWPVALDLPAPDCA
ncbi:glycoside hydrolase family 3 N-terminal domain-containing protein [Demequina sp. NBRC 110057]|uniref:glycoside hydrolase family 3 N-terminal domain-containing protein n=1 Tax=Demequina sp. NBRC 110057 TaxID=1570346 RepID=UPI0009FBF93E|nr:glycoside hydrolase family 3 N-terminal domain-containing protein [Demequina sp. NBRC 110057]